MLHIRLFTKRSEPSDFWKYKRKSSLRNEAYSQLQHIPLKKYVNHNDVCKWKHFPLYWPFVRGIHRSTVNFPHKGQWRRALMFSLICAWNNSWANNGDAGDLRRHIAHYDVTIMIQLLHMWCRPVPQNHQQSGFWIYELGMFYSFESQQHAWCQSGENVSNLHRCCKIPTISDKIRVFKTVVFLKWTPAIYN